MLRKYVSCAHRSTRDEFRELVAGEASGRLRQPSSSCQEFDKIRQRVARHHAHPNLRPGLYPSFVEAPITKEYEPYTFPVLRLLYYFMN